MLTYSYALFENTPDARRAVRELARNEDVDVSLHESSVEKDQIRWTETGLKRGLVVGVALGALAGVGAGLMVVPLGLPFLPFLALGALQGTLIGGLAGGLTGSVNEHKKLQPLLEEMEEGEILVSVQSRGSQVKNAVRGFLETFEPKKLVQSNTSLMVHTQR